MSARILIIDDEPANTRLMRLLLTRNCGYEVMEENNATRAAETAAAFRPDLILLDIIMPGMDGGEVANRIRCSPELADVPIVFVSGAGVTEGSGKGGTLNLQGCPFHTKPVQMEKLLACIREQLPATVQ